METRSPNDGEGGEGRGGRDGAMSPPRAELHHHGESNERPILTSTSRAQASRSTTTTTTTTLSLDQIRVVARCSNEYTDGPTVARKPAEPPLPRQHKDDDNAVELATLTVAVSTPPLSRADHRAAETREERPHDLLPPSHLGSASSSGGGGGDDKDSRPTAGGSSSSDEGSVSSLQRLTGSPPRGDGSREDAVRTQPKRASELEAEEERKPLAVAVVAGSGGGEEEGKHSSNRCAECGRCGCAQCTRPRLLPSCWLCGRRCVCSAQNMTEYATCVCCVRGLFYHCSSDDEDTCADKPFSCTQPHGCARWAAVALLVTVLPCIACYLPAKACATACQRCYDRAVRPGCRCKGGARRHTDNRKNAGKDRHAVCCDAREKPF
ncbi:hypothetical protein NHX12_014858 [Muraenolepis orangiensis]|uniref:Protein sprouty homolog 2 n=1 Tax=Muraenolepis orangiensis TaxID=630683 RepID=A0A9Q0D9B1_9TELE|nr:hypothetical protein NHX12_014858 [Muraenolepis orangiensis]